MSVANPRTLIKFKKRRAPYQVGETAAFADDIAQRYIKAGIAVLAEPPKKKRRKIPELTKEMVASVEGKGYVTK